MNIIARNIIITNKLKKASKFACHFSILSPERNQCCVFFKLLHTFAQLGLIKGRSPSHFVPTLKCQINGGP